MNQEMLIAMVQSDFDVMLWAHRPGRALFGALRKKTWHLIVATFKQDSENEAYFHTNISQLHVPRFLMVSREDSCKKVPLVWITSRWDAFRAEFLDFTDVLT